MHNVSSIRKKFQLFVVLFVPALLAIFHARWHSSPADLDVSMFDEPAPPGLGLIQKNAKVIQLSTVHASQKSSIAGIATKTPTTTSSDGKVSKQTAFGVKKNSAGDIKVFFHGLAFVIFVMMVCFCIFYICSKNYEWVYRGNVKKGLTTQNPPLTFFGWATTSWSLTFEDVEHVAGLDGALMFEFVNMGMSTAARIGLPMFFITGPINLFFGGNAAGKDILSWLSIGNVEYKSWVYYVTAFATWYVAWNICRMTHQGMQFMMKERFEWLRSLDRIRSNSLLMLGIPEKQQSDDACKKFWDNLLPGGRVEEVHIARDTTIGDLQKNWLARESLQLKYNNVKAQADKTSVDPMVTPSWSGPARKAVEYYDEEIKKLDELITQACEKIKGMEQTPEGRKEAHCPSGFITFKRREDAEIAISLDLSRDQDEWILEYAPMPRDVIWADMTQDPDAEFGRHMVGYALTAGLVMVYMPLVIAMANVATAINLGPFQTLWKAEAPSIGLTIMVDFLPTLLMLLFQNFFSLYDRTAAQYKLSVWYWWMNVFFVVMITAVGSGFLPFVETLAQHPTQIFALLAKTMPHTTHYYMNYLAMQWYTHSLVLTRYMILLKYRTFAHYYSEEEAIELAEPEDQDYYGIGARCCRWSLMMCIGIVYGTMSPPCALLCWLTMIVIRVHYGYMFTIAETRKPDSGGYFFVRALQNLYYSLHIYFILMLGVLWERGSSCAPTVITAFGWAYVFYKQKKFYNYKWERLPYPELNKELAKVHDVEKNDKQFRQPELYEDPGAAGKRVTANSAKT
jgi:hypothetical protein